MGGSRPETGSSPKQLSRAYSCAGFVCLKDLCRMEVNT